MTEGGQLPTAYREVDKINAAMFDAEAALATRRFEYLVQRRDTTLDRVSFGTFALNGGSLVALMSALGNEQKSLGWLGFTGTNTRYAAVGFAIGAVLSGVSLMIEANLQRREAADAFARQSAVGRLLALFNGPFDITTHERVGIAMYEFHKAPLVDFQYSSWAIALQNLGAGAWLFGIALPLCTALAN